MKYILILGLILLSTISLGGTYHPQTTDDQYVEYAESFHSVGEIVVFAKDKTHYTASAVAIDDHHVLTAAHVVLQDEVVGCVFKINNKPFKIRNITYHKDYGKTAEGGDIAICYIPKKIGLQSYPELYDGDELDQECSIVGFGWYGNFNSGPIEYDLCKRAGTNKIDHIDEKVLVCSSSQPSDKNCTKLEFLINNGDSGGGLFIGNKLAGINSTIWKPKKKKDDETKPDGKYGNFSTHTRIKHYLEWINTSKTR
jgi:hypothetical protein